MAFNHPATAAAYTYTGNWNIYIHYLNGVNGFRKMPADLLPHEIEQLVAKGDKRFTATTTATQECPATDADTGALAD